MIISVNIAILFVTDLTVLEHKIFVHELLTLCESEDADLSKFPCYKSVSSFTPLRKSALRALAACHYLEPKNYCDNIFNVLYKALERPNTELQETAFECMKKFIAGYQIDMKIVSSLIEQYKCCCSYISFQWSIIFKHFLNTGS